MSYSPPPVNGALPLNNKAAIWSQPWKNWLLQTWAFVFDVQNSGVTADRPTTNLYIGKFYFDTTLQLPIWYDGNGVTGWCDAAGNNV